MKKYAWGVGGASALVFGLAVFAFAGRAVVFAVPNDTVRNSANTVSISPVRTDAEIKAGETATVPIKVKNLSNSEMTVRPIENDFIAGSDEDGTPNLILDANEFAPSHSLKRFMKPLSDVTIPANSEAEIKVTIAVPKGAQAGGYYGAVRFQPITPEGKVNVNLDTSAASMILITVPGALVEKLNLTDFAVYQGEATNSWFQSSNDMKVKFRMTNSGNVQVGPFGAITVKQGDKVLYTADFNQDAPKQLVLPDSARKWEVPLKEIGSFGKYTVEAVLTYGKSNQSINVTKSFWIIPAFVIAIAVGGTLALIGLIVGVWLFLRSYKRRILNRSGSRRGYRR